MEFKLDDLFNVEAEFELPNGEVVTVRVLTEAEVAERDDAALKAYRAEQERYEKGTEEYEKVFGPLEEADTEALVYMCAAVEHSAQRIKVQRQYPMRYFPVPEEATTEEKIEVMRQQDAHEADIMAKREKALDEHVEKFIERMKQEEDRDKLMRRATRALIEMRGETERVKEFYAQTVHLAARKDGSDGPPYWPIEAVRKHGRRGGLSERVYNEILALYFQIDDADPWTLQKKR